MVSIKYFINIKYLYYVVPFPIPFTPHLPVNNVKSSNFSVHQYFYIHILQAKTICNYLPPIFLFLSINK